MGDREDGNEREWPEPGAGSSSHIATRNRHRLGLRLACSVAVLLVLAWLTRGFLAEVRPRLWPPTDPISQWGTLLTLYVFGYVVVPLMVGFLVTDLFLERFLENQTE